jgi:hypothetical protein
MDDYWVWQNNTVSKLNVVQQELSALTAGCGAYYSACESLAAASVPHVLEEGLKLWVEHRDLFRRTRVLERRLTLVGYDDEIALSKDYLTYLATLAVTKLQSKLNEKGIGHAVTIALRWRFDDGDGCDGGVPLGVDRLGLSLLASTMNSKYEIVTELEFHVTGEGVLFAPTRSAELCKSTNPDLIEQITLLEGVNEYLWDATNWPLIKSALPPGLMGAWSPYMEIVETNVSVLSKTKAGHHPSHALLEQVPHGYDLAVAVSVQTITDMVNAALAEENADKSPDSDLHPAPFEDGTVKLEGGPNFVPPNIEFVIGLYWTSQGGDKPFEWNMHFAGKILLRASFVQNGDSPYFLISKFGDPYEVSVNACWHNEVKDVCGGLGNLPEGFQGAVDSLLNSMAGIDLGKLRNVPIDATGTSEVACEIRPDKAVFLVKMPRVPRPPMPSPQPAGKSR